MQETFQKKRRGPVPTGKGIQIQVRLQPDLISNLDNWIEENAPKASRPEAIRQILKEKVG